MILPYGSQAIASTWQSAQNLSESSRAPALWRHDHNVDNQNMMVLPIIGGRLAMLTEENLPSNTMLMRCKSM